MNHGFGCFEPRKRFHFSFVQMKSVSHKSLFYVAYITDHISYLSRGQMICWDKIGPCQTNLIKFFLNFILSKKKYNNNVSCTS